MRTTINKIIYHLKVIDNEDSKSMIFRLQILKIYFSHRIRNIHSSRMVLQEAKY